MKRRWVVPLLYISFILYWCEIAVLSFGTYYVCDGLFYTCKPTNNPDANMYNYAVYWALLVVLIILWLVALIKLLLSLCMLTELDNWLFRFGRDNPEDDGPCYRFCSFAFLPKTHAHHIRDMAILFSDLFSSSKFVPSDVLAAFVLLFAKESVKKDSIHKQTYSAVVPRGNQGISTSSISNPLAHTEQQWQHPELLLHYLKYAYATYGSYLCMLHPHLTCSKCKQILNGMLCCPCCCCFPSCVRPEHVEGM